MVSRPTCTLSMTRFTGYALLHKGASTKKRTCELTPGSVEPPHATANTAVTKARNGTFVWYVMDVGSIPVRRALVREFNVPGGRPPVTAQRRAGAPSPRSAVDDRTPDRNRSRFDVRTTLARRARGRCGYESNRCTWSSRARAQP